MNRPRSLAVAVLTLTLVAGFLVPTSAQDPRAFVGSWQLTFIPEEGGPPPFLALMTVMADGTILESDDGPPTPHLFTPGHGAWHATGPRDFAVTYVQVSFDEDANSTGTLRARLQLAVDATGNHMNGKLVVEFYDAAGAFLFSGEGVATGTRIRVEPVR